MASLNGKLPIDSFFRKTVFDDGIHLDEKTKLILALRNYTYAVSMLIPAYHFFKAANHSEKIDTNRTYPENIKIHFMQSAMLERLLVQLRRLHETKRSLVTSVAKTLSQPEIVIYLYQRTKVDIEKSLFTKLISCIAREWQLRDDGASDKCPHSSNLISRQNWSARRAANKLASHMTFDDYDVSKLDIECLVQHSALIASLIQRCMGKDVYNHNFFEVEQASYEASIDIFSVKHNSKLIFTRIDYDINRIISDS